MVVHVGCVCVGCSSVAALATVVVLMRVVSSLGCLSLRLTKSLTMEVSQVMWFVKSLFCLLVLVGCKNVLMSSSHLFAGLPCFRYPFCLVEIAGFHLETRFVQRPPWCLPIILACFWYLLRCLRIHDVIPFAANKSSALCVARTMQSTHGSSSSSGSSFGASSKEGLLSASWLLSSFSLGSSW